MVLAAGLGLRMRPLTLVRPKPVLPVLNRPLLHWTLELLARHGVGDVVINLHHRPEAVRRSVGDGRRFGLTVTYSYEPRILGTGGGARNVRRFLGDEPVLVVNGDVAFHFDLTRLVENHRASGAQATLALKPNPDPRRYGPVVTGPGGRVRSIADMPRRAQGTVSLFTGVHVLDPALLDRLPPGSSDSVRDLYAPLVGEGGRVRGIRVMGAWYDLGSPSLYLVSHHLMLRSGFGGVAPRPALVDPTARVATGATVIGSVIGPGSIVDEGASVRGSVLWERVRVGAGASVSRSILASGARVRAGDRVEGSLIVPRDERRGRTRDLCVEVE